MLSDFSVRENLTMMKAKLESFALGLNGYKTPVDPIPSPAQQAHSGITVNVNNTNTNTIELSISFEQAREKIEDMTALNREQTDEILEKINELEAIANEKSSKKSKWEKIKPILAFAIDKGVDVAVAIITLVSQMGLGK